MALAQIMIVVAMDLVQRGVNSGAGKEDAPAEQPQQQRADSNQARGGSWRAGAGERPRGSIGPRVHGYCRRRL